MLVCASPAKAPEVVRGAGQAGVPVALLGASGGDRLIVEGLIDLSLDELQRRWRQAIPSALDTGVAS